MAACDPIVLSDISEEVFSNVKKDLASAGFPLSGSSGTVNGPFGIVIRFAYNEPTKVLEIEIVEKSFFVSCSQIKDKLYAAFDKYVSR